MENQTTLKGLVVKLCEVMAAVERVPKRGRNSFHGYDYVTEADLADALRKELSSRSIFIFPNVVSCIRSPLEVETKHGVRKTQLTEVVVEWLFVDGESGQERKVQVHGVGEDNVDKGFYKAFTGSEKYMLMKSFLVPTGDDPEADVPETSGTDRTQPQRQNTGPQHGQRPTPPSTPSKPPTPSIPADSRASKPQEVPQAVQEKAKDEATHAESAGRVDPEAIPTPEQLEAYKTRALELVGANGKLKEAGLKDSRGLPAKAKLKTYILHACGVKELSEITIEKWDFLLFEIDAMLNGGPEKTKQMIELIEAQSKEKK